MSTEQDQTYRKIGRGGAGNFFTAKQVQDEATSKANEDIEAQNPTDVPAPSVHPPAPTPMRGGRGGAGNYVDPATATAMSAAEDAAEAEALSARTKQAAPKKVMLGGRGGAGNWQSKEEEKADDEEQQKEKEEMERRVLEEVEQGLRVPEPAFQKPVKTRG